MSDKAEDIMMRQAEIVDSNIIRVIRIASQIEKNNPDIAWLYERVKVLSNVDPMYITGIVKTKIAEYTDKIYARDENFFSTSDDFVTKFVKYDERRDFMIRFIRTIQGGILKVSDKEKDVIWQHLINIANAVQEFRHNDPDDPFRRD